MAEEILDLTGSLRMRVLGESMLPTIWPGDVLTIAQQEVRQFAIGDIGLFRRQDRFFVHRIQNIVRMHDSLHFIARGDSVLQADPPFQSKELLGRVVEVQRNNKARTPAGSLCLQCRIAGWLLSRCNRLRSLSLRLHAQLRIAPAQEFGAPTSQGWDSAGCFSWTK
jgi:hypothetical protein